MAADRRFGRWFVLAAIALWSVGAGIAFAAPVLPAPLNTNPAAQAASPEAVPWEPALPSVLVLVLSNNLLVLLTLWAGLISGGLLSAAGLVWNGMVAGLTLRHGLVSGFERSMLVHSVIWHGPLEVAALLWAGAVGLRGAAVTADLARWGRVEPGRWPSRSDVLGPALLILVAAVVEAAVVAALAVPPR